MAITINRKLVRTGMVAGLLPHAFSTVREASPHSRKMVLCPAPWYWNTR